MRNKAGGPRGVLLLTVGTGDLERPLETLVNPLIRSMRRGTFERIVLLPSWLTAGVADRLRGALGDLAIEVAPLPARGQENDLVACCAYYEDVFGRLCKAGYAPQDMVADFTRGTKVMGAALVLAAVRRGVGVLRYVAGERDSRGMVKSGAERVREFRTADLVGRSLEP